MRNSAVRDKNLIVLLAALKFNTVSIRLNCHKIIHLDVESTLLALENNAAIRNIQDSSEGLILNIVHYIRGTAAIVVTDILKDHSAIAGAMRMTNVAFLDRFLFIDRLVDIMTLLAALQEYLVRIQDRQPSTHDLLDSGIRKNGLDCRNLWLKQIKKAHCASPPTKQSGMEHYASGHTALQLISAYRSM